MLLSIRNTDGITSMPGLRRRAVDIGRVPVIVALLSLFFFFFFSLPLSRILPFHLRKTISSNLFTLAIYIAARKRGVISRRHTSRFTNREGEFNGTALNIYTPRDRGYRVCATHARRSIRNPSVPRIADTVQSRRSRTSMLVSNPRGTR